MLNRWKKKKKRWSSFGTFPVFPSQKNEGGRRCACVTIGKSAVLELVGLFCIFDYATMCVFAPHFLRRGWREPVLHSVADLPGMDTKKNRWGGDRRKFVGNPLRAPTGSWFEYLWKRNWNSLPGKNQSVYIRLQVFFFWGWIGERKKKNSVIDRWTDGSSGAHRRAFPWSSAGKIIQRHSRRTSAGHLRCT